MVQLFGYPVSLLLLLAGAALVVAEALAPGAHFIVIGVALLAAGLVGVLLGDVLAGAGLLLVLAAVVVVAGGASLYAYRQFDFYGGESAGQTSDSSSLRGQVGRVTERVTETEGEVKLDGGGFNPYFRARTIDGEIPEGEEVIVVDPGGGNVVTVESIAGLEGDDIDRELARGRREPEEETEREPDTA
jgi:membrane protein implicated in regulation of membrane protease activity